MFDPLTIDHQLAQIFLTSARCACFRQAARSLNLHIVPMRKKLRKLEATVGTPLFLYKGRELSLSATGRELQQLLTQKFGDLHPEDVECPASVWYVVAVPDVTAHRPAGP